jgi:hypothetical protein
VQHQSGRAAPFQSQRRRELETELSKLARFGGGKDIKFSGGFELKPRAV